MILFFIFSCNNEEEESIVFKDVDYQVYTDDTIYVQLNTSDQLIVETISAQSQNVHYFRSVDDGDLTEITDTDDVDILTESYSDTYEEQALVETTFSDSVYSSGSVVEIYVRNGQSLSNRIFYKIQ